MYVISFDEIVKISWVYFLIIVGYPHSNYIIRLDLICSKV